MKKTYAEQFLSACGSEQPLRVAVNKVGESSTENWVFARPYLVIGRRADSDLALDHWQISRRHAYLQFLDGGFFCVDLGSRTGTHGGNSTERSGWIAREQMIQLGPFEVRPSWPSRPPHLLDRGPEDLPGVVWELPKKAIGSAVWRMERQLVLVGRAPSCRIRLVERDVSKFHCSLIRTSLGVWVVDLLGQNGIFVNDEPVRCARLDDGDELRIGRHVLRPRYDTALPLMAETSGELVRAEITGPGAGYPPSLPALTDAFAGKSTPARLTFRSPAMPPAGVDLARIIEGQGPSIDPVMSAMVQQFGLMQQQMFAQFHQTMMAMFEGFSAMHREQSETMREEIEQVRRLSREIEELQAETERLLERSGEQEAEAEEESEPEIAPVPSWLPTPLPGPIETIAERTPTMPTPPPASMPRKTSPHPVKPAGDIHALLVSRLATIHTERQGRWQKILGMMSSRS